MKLSDKDRARIEFSKALGSTEERAVTELLNARHRNKVRDHADKLESEGKLTDKQAFYEACGVRYD